ncbi:uncharacterized protein LOC102715028 [Oryza brachyantha]|uniref:uncharacterized protein LOC102715028 n=1 Tax=Oryza brachyantha TaxID=4533 RepID=UPI0007761B13|nr:uncharacterized protein LOC102715028 [Oryza brachyantha]
MQFHLGKYGFKANYEVWIAHGETLATQEQSTPEDGSESVGRMEPATNWKHYQAAVDPLGEYGNLLERVEADFWAQYRWKEGHEAHAKKVLFNVIKNKIGQMLYWTRIQAVLRYYKEILKIPTKEEEACTIYLTQEQYIQCRQNLVGCN